MVRHPKKQLRKPIDPSLLGFACSSIDKIKIKTFVHATFFALTKSLENMLNITDSGIYSDTAVYWHMLSSETVTYAFQKLVCCKQLYIPGVQVLYTYGPVPGHIRKLSILEELNQEENAQKLLKASGLPIPNGINISDFIVTGSMLVKMYM
jgi:hypothetical protein